MDWDEGNDIWTVPIRGWNVISLVVFLVMPCHDILFQWLRVGVFRDEQGIVEGDIASDGYFYVIGGRASDASAVYDTNERLKVGTDAVTVDYLYLPLILN